MNRPQMPYAAAIEQRESEQRMWAELGRILATDQDPRPDDERQPRPTCPLLFLVLAALAIVGVAWALMWGAAAILTPQDVAVQAGYGWRWGRM